MTQENRNFKIKGIKSYKKSKKPNPNFINQANIGLELEVKLSNYIKNLISNTELIKFYENILNKKIEDIEIQKELSLDLLELSTKSIFKWNKIENISHYFQKKVIPSIEQEINKKLGINKNFRGPSRVEKERYNSKFIYPFTLSEREKIKNYIKKIYNQTIENLEDFTINFYQNFEKEKFTQLINLIYQNLGFQNAYFLTLFLIFKENNKILPYLQTTSYQLNISFLDSNLTRYLRAILNTSYLYSQSSLSNFYSKHRTRQITNVTKFRMSNIYSKVFSIPPPIKHKYFGSTKAFQITKTKTYLHYIHRYIQNLKENGLFIPHTPINIKYKGSTRVIEIRFTDYKSSIYNLTNSISNLKKRIEYSTKKYNNIDFYKIEYF